MEGAAKKWRPGRGRRPGWGALAGGVDGGADGSGGPGGGGPVAAAPSAPPGASGLRLRLSCPDAYRSNLRLCCSSSWRCRRRRRCSCCHSLRPGPRRRQLRTRPWPRLHPRGGVARPRRARLAGCQRGHSSQARDGRSRTPRYPPPAAAAAESELTLIPRGARAPGGASLPAPSPSHRSSWPGRPPPDDLALCGTPSPLLPPTRHKNGERPADGPQPRRRASWELACCARTQARSQARDSLDAPLLRAFVFSYFSGVPLSNLTSLTR